MRVDLDKLPNDLAFLKQMVREMAGALKDLQQRNKHLEHQLALLRLPLPAIRLRRHLVETRI